MSTSSEIDLEAAPTEASARALGAHGSTGSCGRCRHAGRGEIWRRGGALAALDRHRLLCAHRRGPYGVLRWGLEVERWLAEAIPGYGEDGEWYVGRPLLITANDYEMSLYNGDTGSSWRHPTAYAPPSPAAPRPSSSRRCGWTPSRPCMP